MLITLLAYLIYALIIAIIVRSLLSWVDPQGRNPVSQILFQITEPVLAPVRNLMGGGIGGLDLSPLIVIIVLQVILQALGGVR